MVKKTDQETAASTDNADLDEEGLSMEDHFAEISGSAPDGDEVEEKSGGTKQLEDDDRGDGGDSDSDDAGDDDDETKGGEGDKDSGDAGQDEDLPDDPDQLRQLAKSLKQENTRLQHQYTSQTGRVKGLNRKLHTLTSGAKKARDGIQEAAKAASLSDDDKDDEDREFEEHSGDVVRQIDKRAKAYSSQIVTTALDPLVTAADEIEDDVAAEAKAELLEQFPDAVKIAESEEFQKWLQNQSPLARRAFDDGNVDDAVWLLSLYTDRGGAGALPGKSSNEGAPDDNVADADDDAGKEDDESTDRKKATRVKRAKASPRSTRSAGGGRPVQGGDETEFEQEFNNLAKEHDAKLRTGT